MMNEAAGRRDPGGALVVQADPHLYDRLRAWATLRMVFFAGLPGTGKSLLAHQLAHLAHAAGRTIHLLQWDVARPVFEASEAGRPYPLVGGVTHAVIRKAVGLWARQALAAWAQRHPGPEHFLIGETPFVGNRFVELARREDDAVETLLAAPACRFVVAVPSREVRSFLEAERERRVAQPLHAREREDAPPSVLRDLWGELAEVARRLGIAGSAGSVVSCGEGSGSDAGPAASVPYDPVVYQRVYERLLRHRVVEVISVGTILPVGALSVYDFTIPRSDLAPVPEEASRFVREAERSYPDLAALEREVGGWWEV